jgi:hypothetical protein
LVVLELAALSTAFITTWVVMPAKVQCQPEEFILLQPCWCITPCEILPPSWRAVAYYWQYGSWWCKLESCCTPKQFQCCSRTWHRLHATKKMKLTWQDQTKTMLSVRGECIVIRTSIVPFTLTNNLYCDIGDTCQCVCVSALPTCRNQQLYYHRAASKQSFVLYR